MATIANVTLSATVLNSNITTANWLNSTEHVTEYSKYLTNTQQVIITICYTIGVIGNLLALILLYKKSTKPNNAKHRLMLRCLATNDLVAMLGMLTQMYIQLYLSHMVSTIWFCRFRVFWRVFGLGSGCVAIVMAVERWLALTQPFLYQKHVTVTLIARYIFGLWTTAIILVCLPFFGFGIYFDHSTDKCVRYRRATLPKDIAYAYLYFATGLLLCNGILFCNLTVMRSLCNKGETLTRTTNDKKSVLMRKMSRTCSRTSTTSTREELAFGRLMGFLCMIFVICWVPQLMTIPLTQIFWEREDCNRLYRAADMLMALHFVLDPYLYVLQRWSFFRKIFYPKNHGGSLRSKNSSFKIPSSTDHSVFISSAH